MDTKRELVQLHALLDQVKYYMEERDIKEEKLKQALKEAGYYDKEGNPIARSNGFNSSVDEQEEAVRSLSQTLASLCKEDLDKDDDVEEITQKVNKRL